MKDPFYPLVRLAQQGSQTALEELVQLLKDRIYGISLRMLYHPQDAEDAAQEILIKIVVNLGAFRADSAFYTWVYKIATNHLLSVQRKRGAVSLSFEEMADRIVPDWPKPWRELESEPMQGLIVEEFRIACLQMVLLGLDRSHRLAYILGEIFDVTGKEGAAVLSIRPAAYRKRLQRAKFRVQNFLLNHCALIKPDNPCICERQTDHYLAKRTFDGSNPLFVKHPCYVRHDPSALSRLQELDELKRISALMKTHPGFRTPTRLLTNIRSMLNSNRFELL